MSPDRTRHRRRIHLVRHAEVVYFEPDGTPHDPQQVALTEQGRAQARAAADLLAAVPFDLAVCSGLPRTVQTARIVLGERTLPLHEEGRWHEIRGARVSDEEAAAVMRTITQTYVRAAAPGARFLGGEPWADFEARVLAAWADLLARDDWSDALVVAHDAVNRVLLAHVAGAGLAGLRAFEQDPACVNMIDVDHPRAAGPPAAFLRAVNLVPYDPARLDERLTVMERLLRSYRPADTGR